MIAIEPTREVVSRVYETLNQNLGVVRAAQHRPLTLADKILLGHLDDPTATGMVRGQTYVQLRPDRVILQDVLGQTAMLQFMQTRRGDHRRAYVGALRSSDPGAGGRIPRFVGVAGGKR